MAFSVVNYADETRLRFGVSLVNKLARQGILTDALVAAATSFQDLMDDIASAIFQTTTNNELYPEHIKTEVRYLLAELTFLNGLDILTDTVVTNLLTVRGTAAVTDLRWNFYSYITDASFDYTDESFVEGAFGASAYTANLT